MTPTSVQPKPTGAYRVLHTADWHLGKMLGEHSRAPEHARFLQFLLQTIREQVVDLLIVAGDIFDSANPPQSAAAQYYNFLSELFRQGGCAVIAVAGNHDSPAHLEAPRQVLQALGAHVIGAWPASPAEVLIPLPNTTTPRLVVAAVPFLRDRDVRTGQTGQSADEIQQALVAGITRRYAEAAEAAKPWSEQGIPLLAIGHLTVAGARPSDSERAIHVGGLGAVSADCFPAVFDYVALGHLHRPQSAGGREQVVYAGSPIPLSFGEVEDLKSVRLLDFADGKLASQTTLPIPVARRLAQICTSRQTLAADLAAFQPVASDLAAWVEVVITDPVAGENLYGRAQELATGRGFEVMRVVNNRTAVVDGLGVANPENLPNPVDLLARPADVFAHRLAEELALTAEEREGLVTVFQELLNLHAEMGRGADVPGPTILRDGGEA